MADALVDSNVVLGARLQRDQYHEGGRAIVAAMDAGELPRGRLVEHAVPEILTPIGKRAGHDAAVETLTFLTESRGFDVCHTTTEDYTRAEDIYRRTAGVEFVDCMTVAYMRRIGLEYVYSFDDDFDRFDDVTRLDTATNPFA